MGQSFSQPPSRPMQAGLHPVGSNSQDYRGVLRAYLFNLAQEDHFAILDGKILQGLIQYLPQLSPLTILERQGLTVDQGSRQGDSASLILKGIEREAPALASNQPAYAQHRRAIDRIRKARIGGIVRRRCGGIGFQVRRQIKNGGVASVGLSCVGPGL